MVLAGHRGSQRGSSRLLEAATKRWPNDEALRPLAREAAPSPSLAPVELLSRRPRLW